MNAATVLLVKVPQAQRLLVPSAARQGPPGPNGPLDVLTDVDTAGAAEGQVLTYSPSLGGEPWKPRTLTELLAGSQETGPLRVVADVATNPILVLTALPAQTGDYLQALDSVGAKVASIASNGTASFASGTTVGGSPVVVTTDPRLSDQRVPVDGSVTLAKIVAGGLDPTAITGTAVITTDPRLSDTRAPNGPAGGVLAGTYPNPGLAGSPSFRPLSASSVGLIVKGLASQVSDLQQWQDSTGAVLGWYSAAGYLNTNGLRSVTTGKASLVLNADTGGMAVLTGADANKGLVIRRNSATQSANLFEIQDETGAQLVYTQATGKSFFMSGFRAYNGAGVNIFEALAGGGAIAQAATASSVSMVIKGAAAQTAHLMDFTNSAGTLLSRVQSDGAFFGPYFQHNSSSAYLLWSSGTPENYVPINQPAHVGLVLKGAALQTGDLQQWQDSSANILASISAGGVFAVPDPSGTGGHHIGGPAANGTELTVDTRFASFVGLVVRGRAAQTSDLIQTQDSSGANLARISNNGNIYAASSVNAALFQEPTQAGPYLNATTGTMRFYARNVGDVPLSVRAAASPTANMTEWQTSTGTVVSSISSVGEISSTTRMIAPSWVDQSAGAGKLVTLHDPAYRVLTTGTGVADIVLGVRGAPSQTGDLQEWQDSTGTVIARVRPNGTIVGLTNVSGALAIEAQPQHAAALGLAVTAFNGQTADLTRWRDVNGNILTRVLAAGGIQSYGVTHTFDTLAVPTGVAAGAPVPGGAFAAGTYYWIVTATNTAGETIRSAEVSAVVALNQQVTITWSQVTGATGYKVYRSAVSGTYTSPALVATITNGTTTSFIDTGAAPAAGAPPTAPTGTKLSLKAWASQSGANVFEILNSASGLVAGIGPGIVGGLVGAFQSQNAIVNSGAVGVVGLIVKGGAGQTADLMQLQNSAGTTVLSFSAIGNLQGSGAGAVLRPSYDTGGWGITTNADANKGLVLRRNSATQTANLFEIQTETGALLSGWKNNGDFTVTDGVGNERFGVRANGTPSVVFNANGGSTDVAGGAGSTARFNVGTLAAASIGIAIRGVAAQSGDLEQWQNSAATVLAKIDSGGNMRGNALTTLNSRAAMAEEQSGGKFNITKAVAQVTTPAAGSLSLYVRDGTNAGTLKLVALGPGGVQTTILDNIA